MFVDTKLCIVLVGICMVTICEANYYSDYLSNHYNDYAEKLSSYIRKVGEFVDPHTHHKNEPPKERSFSYADVTYNKANDDDNRSSDTTSCYEELRKCWATKSTDISDELMSRRIINILLSRAKVREEGSIIRRYIVIETSESEQEALKKFGSGELKLREIDPILNNAIKTPDGFYDYVIIVYAYMTTLVNRILDNRGIVISIIVLLALYETLQKTRWNFRMILFASIHVLLTISFLISWWKVLQKEKVNKTESRNSQIPIQCEPNKMRWMDKAMTWFYDYDCDKYHEAQLTDYTSENTPDDDFGGQLGEALIQTIVLVGKCLWWIPSSMTENFQRTLAWTIGLILCGLVHLCIIAILIWLYRFIREPRKICATIEKNILEFLQNLQTQKANESIKHELPDKKNMYYKISCGTGRSVILKTTTTEENLEGSELETKINGILGKSMRVEKIVGRIATREGQQITVAMERKEDKAELIERWQELRDNGFFVEDDIFLLDQTARWIILGLAKEEKVEEESRQICINGERWMWDGNTREWVQNEIVEPENIQDSIKEETS